MTHCCKEFAEQAGELTSVVAGGGLYPPAMRPRAQFEPDDNEKTWNINGCCGGGCFVVTGMRFCPYCGKGLSNGNND